MRMLMTFTDGTVRDCEVTGVAYGDVHVRDGIWRLSGLRFWVDGKVEYAQPETIARIEFYPQPGLQTPGYRE